MSLTFTVGTADLRRGFAAVTPHMSTDKEAAEGMRVVRLELLTRYVLDGESTELLMQATDGRTAGVYSAEALSGDAGTEGPAFVDLTAADIAKVLAVFRAATDTEDASVLRFTCTEKAVTIRDVSGLFEGHELDLPATPGVDFPNVPALLAGAVSAASVGSHRRFRMRVGRTVLERFAKSAKAVDMPLTMDRYVSPLVIHCGETFVGLAMPHRMTDEDNGQADDALRSWTRSLDMLAARRALTDDPALIDVTGAPTVPDQSVAADTDDPGPTIPEAGTVDPGAAQDDVVPTDWLGVIFDEDKATSGLDEFRPPPGAELVDDDDPDADWLGLEVPSMDAPAQAPGAWDDQGVRDAVAGVTSPFTDSSGNEWPTANPFSDA